MTKVIATSDWHGELPTDLPTGDVLVIAGDLLPVWDHNRQYQSEWTKTKLIPHLGELPFEEIIFVGGNHDFLFEESKKFIKLLPENVHYLEDEYIDIDGKLFYGSPWSTRFGDWAFMLHDTLLKEKWDLIPDEVDVLIVHGPPYGACDLTDYWGNEHVGSKTLRERIIETKPKYVVTGHIHEAYGADMIGKTLIFNVSLMDLDYVPVNEPMSFHV